MTLKPLKTALVSALSTGLTKFGYKQVGDREFQKKYPWGKAVIHLAFIDHAADFDVTVDCGLRYSDLEEIISRNESCIPEREKKRRCSIGAEMGNILRIGQKRWKIRNEDDVAENSADMLSKIIEAILPFIEKYEDRDAALEALSRDDENAWRVSAIDNERAKRAVGLAYLLGYKEQVRDLVRSKRAYLQRRNDFGLSSFEEFVKSLGDEYQ